ncbi:TCR/Tet family MFS transporter [Derxia lacustris]|uniref:TCR/Tet family MFS transporter n=1 Tax=Derxia lacustris TaxID=764842 RepID=UPI000A1701A8|nr:TCR/Tet family MFS transporter [Derxia lacustris]
MTQASRGRSARQPAVAFVMVTVLIDVIGFGLILPVLPTVIAGFTTGSEAQAWWYGLISAGFGLAQFLLSPLLGALSDRFGRRPLLLLGVAGLGADFLLTALAPSLAWLVAARLIGGALSANVAVAQAYIADITPPQDRARRFGMLGAAFGIGFIVGPVIGGLLGDGDPRLPFFVAAGLAGVNWLYGLLVLPESLPPERRHAVDWRRANPFRALLALAQLRGVGLLIAAIALSGLAQFILHSTWVLSNQFRFGWGARENGLSLFAVGIVAVVVQGGLLGRLIKWLGTRRLAVISLAWGTVAYVLYGLATAGWMMVALILFNFLSFASNSAFQGLVSEAADAQTQGATMGALSSLNSLTMVAAPLIGAALLAQVSHLPAHDWRAGATFFLSAALSAASLLLALRQFSRMPRLAPASP